MPPEGSFRHESPRRSNQNVFSPRSPFQNAPSQIDLSAVPSFQNGISPHQQSREQSAARPSKETFSDISVGLSDSRTSPSSVTGATNLSSSSPASQSWSRALFSPVQSFHELEQSKEDASLLTQSMPSSTHDDGFNLPLIGAVKWEDVKSFTKDWMKSPKNLALLLWGLAVGASGALLFLVMTGLLDKQLPSKSQRDAWFEVNNQILNALFTLMCVYLHPQRCLHLIMLLRWGPQDISRLRQLYCKNGTYKPHEWSHIFVVVLLLQLNCLAQYALCGLNWGFKRSQRPPIGVGLCLAVAIGASAGAGLYSILSPLGKSLEVDAEHNVQEAVYAHKAKLGRTPSLRIGRPPSICFGNVSSMSNNGPLIEDPEWQGNLFDCCKDPPVAVLSTLCPFCVFGWNMERLGLGNRYVHIVTFILLCTAPYWIFTLAAINIDNVRVRRGLGDTGIILCIFGLIYGGFWRMHMRKTFGLPADTWCFGKAALTDYVKWLFCAPCSLCQEVRTSEHYKIQESKFYERKALSEVSSVPSPSSERTPSNLCVREASSPMPFTNFYADSIFSESKYHSSALLDDARLMMTPQMTTRGYMEAPTPQVLFP